MQNNPQEYTEELQKIDITDTAYEMVNALRRHLWKMIVIIAVCAAIGGLSQKAQYEPEWKADTTYVVSANTTTATIYTQAATANMAKTVQKILESEVARTLVATDMGVDEVPGTITVSSVEGTNVITIEAHATKKDAAEAILNSVINVYPTLTSQIVGDTSLEVMGNENSVTLMNPLSIKRAVAAGAVVGVLIVIVILMAMALSRKTIRSEEDLQEITNVPCFGIIPIVHFKKRKNAMPGDKLVLFDNSRTSSGFQESIRSLRTRFEQELNEKVHQVFVVTSSSQGEGKSMVAANLAISLAKRGISVVLADMDLRNPSTAESLGLGKYTHGICDVLAGNATAEETALVYEDLPLYILPGGRPVAQTARLMNDQSLQQLTEQLREMADVVILDTPPCGTLSDAILIGAFADSGIYVIRQDYLRTEQVSDGLQSISETGLPLCGCVINGVEAGKTGFTYGRTYGAYGRYGGYGRYGSYGRYGRYGSYGGYGRYGGYGYGAYGSDYGLEDLDAEEDTQDQ